jgi:integrase
MPSHGAFRAEGARCFTKHVAPRGGAPRERALGIAARSQMHTPERFRAAVYVMAYRRLRIGELAALRVDDLDLMHGTLRVDENLVEVSGTVIVGPLKTAEGNRAITLPPFLEGHACRARRTILRSDGSLGVRLHLAAGSPLRPVNYRRRVFDPAVGAAGLSWRPTPHNLRDTAATLAITAGADIRRPLQCWVTPIRRSGCVGTRPYSRVDGLARTSGWRRCTA